jgi:Fic family protein
LQEIVIGDKRFTRMGWRQEGGFIGVHDRVTNAPIPDHISARWQDITPLIAGLIATGHRLSESNYDPVLAAAMIAFGYVFIHPFEDGNGRIHRYLIHHVLAEKGFAPKGIVFPVSAVILERIDDYRRTLEAYSKPRLDLIEWKPTHLGNVEVLNEPIDLYRYFDATRQAEFLYDCVRQTVEKTLPEEVAYLSRHAEMLRFIDDHFDMPDKVSENLIAFLRQGNGKLSKRTREKEFQKLTGEEVETLEDKFAEIFKS